MMSSFRDLIFYICPYCTDSSVALTPPSLSGTYLTCTCLAEQKLVGSDTDGQDAFGHSVSVDEDNELLVVGAPYAEDYGVTEVCRETLSVRERERFSLLGFGGVQVGTRSGSRLPDIG